MLLAVGLRPSLRDAASQAWAGRRARLHAGIARVKPRDSPAAWGTDGEAKMRQPDDPFFKKFAAECSRVQIAVDIFSFWCGPPRATA